MIKLIYGPMRSGKSARLIEEIEDAKSKKLKIRCYKPEIDTRSKYIKSRNGSTNISTLSNWQSLLTGSNGTIAENESKIQNAISIDLYRIML